MMNKADKISETDTPAEILHEVAVEVRSLLEKPQEKKYEGLTDAERKKFFAICQDLKLDEDRGLQRAIREFIRNNPLRSERFFGRRHFAIPHETFILLKVSGKDLDKLQNWLDAKNKVELATGSHELWIFNETLLEKTREERSDPSSQAHQSSS